MRRAERSRIRVFASPAIHQAGLLLWVALGLSLPAAARSRGQDVQAGPRIAMAARVKRAPRLDGTLDDPLWRAATPIIDFRQREPAEGKAATESTSVRILYTRRAVYFGVKCADSTPARIIATELRRDLSQ
ncbi:MAG TPA: hypothetical protein VF154_08670, partial [Terriglobales bacterium]